MATHWRIRNARRIADSWNVRELTMFSGETNLGPHVSEVICSYCGPHRCNLNGPGLIWAGDDRPEGQAVGGSWLGFIFDAPFEVTDVQVIQSCDSSQSVGVAWLEYTNVDMESAGIGWVKASDVLLGDGESLCTAVTIGEKSKQWRIRNDTRIADHWNVRELTMFCGETDLQANVSEVICSFNYDQHDLMEVYNKIRAREGDGSDRMWAGAKEHDATDIGGSWLGFVFDEPREVTDVWVEQSYDTAQSVGQIWLEFMNDAGAWVKAKHFEIGNDDMACNNDRCLF